MRQGQFRVRPSPCCGGAYTQVQLCGFVPTAAPPTRTLKRLAAGLALWSGWPVAVALSAAPDTADWCEAWVACLQDIPEHQLVVRLARRHGTRAQASERP
jgi:hypothetical protein